jgi:hypothetical protein
VVPPPVAPRPRAVSQRAEPKVSELDVEGSLGDGVVTRMLMRSLPLLRTCYADAAQRAGNGDLSALMVSLSIDETGSVRDVRTGTHPLPGLSSCASATLRRLRSDIKPDIGKVRVRFQVQLVPL